jgi:hypothetical protein
MGRKAGFALISAMMFVGLLLSVMTAFYLITNIEFATNRSAKNSATGFFTSEAGLNIRADLIRAIFVGYNRPAGTSPSSTSPCIGSNLGTGDFVCSEYTFGKHRARTYVTEAAGNPIITTIPAGERYQYLSAQEYRYSVNSAARGVDQKVEAMLELRFKSRLVPLFQFMAFYDKDLEILPGPNMTLNGPVHTNGDLYLESGALLTVQGQLTTAGRLYRGRKNTNTCISNSVAVFNPGTATQLIPSCSNRYQVAANQVNGWNGMIQIGVPAVTVPDVGSIDPTAGRIYWDRADLRLVLRLNNSNNPDTTNASTAVEVRNADNSVNTAATTALTSCAGAIGGRVANNTNTFYSNREGAFIRMLDVDMGGLFNCLQSTNWFSSGKLLSDSTDGGLVFHFSVSGPNSLAAQSRYGVRLRNAQSLRSTVGGAPTIRGLTVVSDQAAYTMGNYNSTNKRPAAILCDAFNVLSGALTDASSSGPLSGRTPTNTTVNAAIMAGTDTTGNVEGLGGQGGAYNGGLENYPRFHENWNGARTLTYSGSFVSLGRPRRNAGVWVFGGTHYTAPVRVWGYDTMFNDAANLPPLSPRFVYLRQELFVRQFEQ